MPWPSWYWVRPTVKSRSFSPSPEMLLPERQPMYASSMSNEEASSPTRLGAAPKVRTPTALNFPKICEELEVVYAALSAGLIDASDQLSLRSPDGCSGFGSVYSESAKPKVPALASKLNVQSSPSGRPGSVGGASACAGGSSARTDIAASARNMAGSECMTEFLWVKISPRCAGQRPPSNE